MQFLMQASCWKLMHRPLRTCSKHAAIMCKQVVEIEQLTSCDVPLMHAPAENSSSIMSLHICRSSTWQAEVRDGWPCMHATLDQQQASNKLSMACTSYQHMLENYMSSDMGHSWLYCQQSSWWEGVPLWLWCPLCDHMGKNIIMSK